MNDLDSFRSYFGRLATPRDFMWITIIWLFGVVLRKRLSKSLGVSVNRYLLINLAFAGLLGLSLRFWVLVGTLSTFWLIAPELWSNPFSLNANFLLNVCLYFPPAFLLVLAGRSWWGSAIFFCCLSFTIETIQQYARIGQGDPIDWFANSFGAVLGIAAGLILRLVLPKLTKLEGK